MLSVIWLAHEILITKTRLLKINNFTIAFPYTTSTYNLNIKLSLSYLQIYKFVQMDKFVLVFPFYNFNFVFASFQFFDLGCNFQKLP